MLKLMFGLTASPSPLQLVRGSLAVSTMAAKVGVRGPPRATLFLARGLPNFWEPPLEAVPDDFELDGGGSRRTT